MTKIDLYPHFKGVFLRWLNLNAKENPYMETSENQVIKSSRDRLKDRLSKRFPDKQFVGQDGLDVQDAMDDSIEEMFGEYESRENEYNENSRRLNDLFASDPRIGSLFMRWAEGGNIMEHLIEDYGDEFLDALASEEGKQRFLDSHNKWLDRMANSRKANEEADANFRESMSVLDAFQEEHNLTDEQAFAVFDKIHQIGSDMARGIYTAESYLLALNAINHDKDVASARAEGELAGKNAKIREKMRGGDELQRNLPPSLGGQGSGVPERKPKTKTRTALDMFGLGE